MTEKNLPKTSKSKMRKLNFLNLTEKCQFLLLFKSIQRIQLIISVTFCKMKTQLLFVPFPKSNGKITDPNGFAQLFPTDHQKIADLANKTKCPNPDISAFRPYILALSTKRKSQIQAVWSDPFNVAHNDASRAIESEIAATIWNYIATLHNKILSMNASDTNDLKSMKADFQEIRACNVAFQDILLIIQNPIFTPALSNFMALYSKFIHSIWQLFVVINLNEKLSPKVTVTCINNLQPLISTLPRLSITAQNYFSPALTILKSYLEGYLRYRLAMQCKDSAQYGDAISYLQAAQKFMNVPMKSTAYTTTIYSGHQMLLKVITETLNILLKDNQTIYHQYVKPDPPPLPPPHELSDLTPSSPLLSGTSTIAQTAPNVVPNMPPMPFQYPTFTTPNVAYPTLQNPIIPPTNPYNAHSSSAIAPPSPSAKPIPNRSEKDLNLEEWKIVCALKDALVPRLNKLMANPNSSTRSVATNLNQKLQVAIKGDEKIASSIKNYTTTATLSADTVNEFIKQADIFYSQLEERLNILERTGK